MDAPEAFALPQDLAGLPRELVFVDLETTGGNAAIHRITEIGIVRVESGVVVEEWSALVNPECRIPPYIEDFTGISNEMVAQAPRFADIARLVLEKLGSRDWADPRRPGPASPAPVFVAHNARFDYSFLRSEFCRVGLRFRAKVLCTVKLSRRLSPQHRRHSLDALIERHDLVCRARHRALGDARVLSDFWLKLRGETSEPIFAAAMQSVLGSNKLPAHLPEDLADELPEGPGVYRFFGDGEALLYIGRSNALRAQVLRHFAVGCSDAREHVLARAVRRIDWLETAGELGALLCEAEWIRTQQPSYNRRPKPAGDSFTIKIAADTGAAEFLPLAAVVPADLAGCRGVFHSLGDARKALTEIARARRLCLKVLGLEESAGSCLASQVGRCKGACSGREPPIFHQVRVQIALSSLKLKPWPFPGRIALRERAAHGDADLHVIDHWNYIGTARCEEELAELALKPASGTFDAHAYRILVRYLANHPKLDWHDLRTGLKTVDVSLGHCPS